MRLAELKSGDLAVITDASLVLVSEPLVRDRLLPEKHTMVDLIERFDELADRLSSLADGGDRVPLEEGRLSAPIKRPGKLWCAAGNYHRASSGLEDGRGRGAASEAPPLELLEGTFLKPPTAIIGPGEDILIPHGHDAVFPELELCVVIGRHCRDVSPARALDAVFGYTVLLDVTARGPQWGKLLQGSRSVRKGFDTFAPVGPWIVTRDEIPNPQDLWMRLHVNNELRQSARTDAMINGVADLVSYLSGVSTFEPGDLISTGNPDSPEFQVGLHAGDTLDAEIEQVGTLRVGVAPPRA